MSRIHRGRRAVFGAAIRAAAAILAAHAVYGVTPVSAVTVTFEDVLPDTPYGGPGGGGYWDGSSGAGGFSSGGIFFSNSYDSAFGVWSGWAYSTVTDSATAGFGNQYGSLAGGGSAGSATYAIAYDASPFGAQPVAALPPGFRPISIDLTNTAYAGRYMLDGSSPPFDPPTPYGGADGSRPDFFLARIEGMAGGVSTGTVEFYLADYRFEDSADDYVVDTWETVDLTPLGNASSLRISFDALDRGPFGINTPTYLAADNLVLAPVPEPGAGVFLLLAGAAFAGMTRRRSCRAAAAAAAVLASGSALIAGPYPPAAGAAGSTAIPADDESIAFWADTVINYSPGSDVDPEWQTPGAALGPAEGAVEWDIVSLGRGGSITLIFPLPIIDGEGADFAVFENGFSDQFLELGFVEVSWNGLDFVRFPCDSRTAFPVGPYEYTGVDPTNVHGLAGKYRAGFGTPFDLADVGLRFATHVRIADVIGGGPDPDTDTSGNIIYDPYPTIGSAGFDLDAVAVIHGGVNYPAWRQMQFGPQAAADAARPDADPDFDGDANGFEFAQGSDPLDRRSRPRRAPADGPGLVFDLDPSIRGCRIEVEHMFALEEWMPIAAGTGAAIFGALSEWFQVAVELRDDGMADVSVRESGPGVFPFSAGLFRLRVEVEP